MKRHHHRSEKLLQAIEQGQLNLVKQLLSGGIGLNAVLHSHVRREGAAALSVAAYEGQLPIIEYLITSGACINYQDPCLKRNALHWACIGGKADAANLLLQQRICVNCQDIDQATAVIYAAAYGQEDLMLLLIASGADVSAVDRLHSSALHYATFHGKSDVVKHLIKAGCIANNPVLFGEGTPLANLAFSGDYENCRLLIEAGYSLKLDTWIPGTNSVQRILDPNHSLCMTAWLLQEYKNPASLYRLCCRCLRQGCRGVRVQEKLTKLPLPGNILRDLTLDNF